MGTPDFSVPTLNKVASSGKHKVLTVFTKPDKINHRGNKIEYSPVKRYALRFGIPLRQPASLNSPDVCDSISKLHPDLILVVAYGKILPKSVLALPRKGCINLHGSLLPKYRGAAPIQRALINGEDVTGVTTMFMNEGMDTGDILLKRELRINEDDGSSSIFGKLSIIGADLVLETLDLIGSNKIERIHQNNGEATYAPPLSKDEARIDWKLLDANRIHNLIRGLDAGPIAYTTLNKKRIKLFRSKVFFDNIKTCSAEPGKVVSARPFIVCCKDNTFLEILEVQPENKKRMNSADFVKGYDILDKILGEQE